MGALGLGLGGLALRARGAGGAALPITYTDKAVGGFSSSAYLASSAGSSIPFAKGATLIVTFQTFGSINSTWEDIISSTDGGGFGGAKGWWLARGGSDSGAHAGYLTLLSGGGTLSYFYAPPSTGITTIAIVWRASDGELLTAVNGSALAPAAVGPTQVAQDGTCFGRVGQPNAFGQALQTMRLLHYAVIPSELTAAQASAYTYTTGNRFVLQAAVKAAASQWVQFSAWDGVSSTLTTGGTSPIAYTVHGTPTLTAVKEQRIVPGASSYWDSRLAIAQTDGSGNTFTVRDPYARLRYTTDATTAAIETYNTSTSSVEVTGLYVNGTWTSENASQGTGAPYLVETALGAGSAKSVDIWEGPQILASVFSSPPQGTFVQAVRFPLLATDGVTAYTTAVRARPSVQKRLVLLTNSIGVGFYATPMTENGLTALLRADFPTSGTGGVTCFGAGLQSVQNIASTPTVAQATARALLAELDASGTNYLVGVSLETNDFFEIQQLAATYQTYAANLFAAVDSIIAPAVPGFTFLWVTALDIYSPSSPNSSTPNSSGSTLAQFRTASLAAGAGYSWFASLSGVGLVSQANYYPGGIHLLAAGDAQLKAAIKTTLGY